MMHTQNGWTALEADSDRLYTWTVPAKNGTFKLRLRRGAGGFLLCHLALWLSEVIEDITGGILDDWAWAPPKIIPGADGQLSNHSSGTAVDLNATKHVWTKRNTYLSWQMVKIRWRLKLYAGCVRWGGDYVHRADEMHFEIDKPWATCRRVSKLIAKTPRGKRLIAANPSQKGLVA